MRSLAVSAIPINSTRGVPIEMLMKYSPPEETMGAWSASGEAAFGLK